jgi:nucleoside-diphosphate-sugar epimerase
VHQLDRDAIDGDMRVLVTGAGGFIGRALVNELLRCDVSVTAASREPVASGAHLTGVVSPVLNEQADWSTALRGVSVVVHCIARVHVMQAPDLADPEHERVNVTATVRLAEQAALAGVRRFVFLSTVKVHGEVTRPGEPLTGDEAFNPSGPYASSKAKAERMLRELCERTGMELVIIRPPLVYGPGAKANFLQLTKLVARGIPLPLAMMSTNRRSLLGLDNLVDLIVECVHQPVAAGHTFLASDGDDLSTVDLVRRLGQAMGVRARLLPCPPRLLALGAGVMGRGDQWERISGNLQVQIERTRRVLRWNPPVTVNEGLRRAVRDLRSYTQ